MRAGRSGRIGPSAPTHSHRSLNGRDLARPIREPALDAGSENRDHPDQQHGHQGHQQPVLRNRDTVVTEREPDGTCTKSIHRHSVAVRVHSRLDGGDLARTSGEPALDARAEHRDDADQQDGYQGDEQPVFRDGDALICLREVPDSGANAVHWDLQY